MHEKVLEPSSIKMPFDTLHPRDEEPEFPRDASCESADCENILVFHHPSDSEGKGTVWSGFINLTNTIVGAGMLGLPGAFAGTGYIGGAILIVLSAFFSAQGLVLLSKAAQRAGLPSSFYSVARAAVPQVTILIDLAVALKCFGVATGYLITIGDCIVHSLHHVLLTGDPEHDGMLWLRIILSRRTWVMGAVVAVSPFSFFRALDDLKKVSALAMAFIFFLAFGIVAYANGLADPCADQVEDDCTGEIVGFTDIPTTMSKLPIFIFAFACHMNMFPIVNELQNRSQARLNWIIVASIGFALVLYYVVAIEGYATFGSNVRGDILLNYPANGFVTMLRTCIAIMLTFHYPLQLDPARRCILSLLAQLRKRRAGRLEGLWRQLGNDGNEEVEDKADIPHDEISQEARLPENEPHGEVDDGSPNKDDAYFYAITVAFLAASFTVALFVDDLGVVLTVVGATGSTLTTYILPGLIYLKLFPANNWTKITACIQLGLGCIIMPTALYFVVSEIFSTNS